MRRPTIKEINGRDCRISDKWLLTLDVNGQCQERLFNTKGDAMECGKQWYMCQSADASADFAVEKVVVAKDYPYVGDVSVFKATEYTVQKGVKHVLVMPNKDGRGAYWAGVYESAQAAEKAVKDVMENVKNSVFYDNLDGSIRIEVMKYMNYNTYGKDGHIYGE